MPLSTASPDALRATTVGTVLEPGAGTSYCEFKGTAGYRDLVAGNTRVRRAGWSYQHPSPAYAEMAGAGEGQSGWWWVAGNLVRDVAALSKMELLPWDVWGAMPGPGGTIGDALAGELDRLAAITADPGHAAESRAGYQSERFRVPAEVYNVVRETSEPVIEVESAAPAVSCPERLCYPSDREYP